MHGMFSPLASAASWHILDLSCCSLLSSPRRGLIASGDDGAMTRCCGALEARAKVPTVKKSVLFLKNLEAASQFINVIYSWLDIFKFNRVTLH